MLAISLLAPFSATTQVLTVCDALNKLSTLNGTEVHIRGIWEISDTGQRLIAWPDCSSALTIDGWIWKPAIDLQREEPNNYAKWKPVYDRWSALSGRCCTLVLATLIGKIRTRDHFKVSRYSGLPNAFGYSPAQLSIEDTRDLEAVVPSRPELERIQRELRSPWPIRLKKTRHKWATGR